MAPPPLGALRNTIDGKVLILRVLNTTRQNMLRNATAASASIAQHS